MKRTFALGFMLALGCGSTGDEPTPSDQPGDAPGNTTPSDPTNPTPGEQSTPPEVPEEWRCLTESDPLLVELRAPARVHYQVPVVDFNSQPVSPAVVPDLQVEVCSGSCEQSLQRCDTDAPAPTQQCYGLSEGGPPYVLVFDLPYAFANGILRFTAPGFVALDYVLGGPLIGLPEGSDMLVTGLALPMLSEQSRSVLYADVGVQSVDPTRGMLVVRALNCSRQTAPQGGLQGTRAVGLEIEAMNVDPAAVGFSLSSGNVATPGSIKTEATGLGGFVSLPPGAISVRAQTPGGELATAIRIRPNVITIAELRPGLNLWGQ